MMSVMKKYTHNARKTVVTTIHQPSSQIFYMFDNILLLCDGQVRYPLKLLHLTPQLFEWKFTLPGGILWTIYKNHEVLQQYRLA